MKKMRFLLFTIFAATTLQACASYDTHSSFENNQKQWQVPKLIEKSYGAVDNEAYYLPPVDMHNIEPKYWRQNVYYPTSYKPGTIIVDTNKRFLYYTEADNQAIRYGIGVGKQGLALKGRAVVGHKSSWPYWTPTEQMIKREPERYGPLAKGMAPGYSNPLGARAMYLYKNGKDSYFRIHGSHEEWSIGKAVSSGCIRMLNQDVMDLYERVKPGTEVIVI